VKAGWIFVKNNGNNEPDLPVDGNYVNPLEIHRITGGPAGFEHTHLLVGGVALPSVDRAGQPDAAHTHYVAWFNDAYQQVTVGATNHTHTLNVLNNVLSPDWFLIFWHGSDADAAIIAGDANCIIAAEAEVTPNEDGGYDIGALDSTPWTPAERTLWETRMRNVLALSLPVQVTAPDRLVALFVGALVSRPQQREVWLRPINI
jgi:hypothetical protein